MKRIIVFLLLLVGLLSLSSCYSGINSKQTGNEITKEYETKDGIKALDINNIHIKIGNITKGPDLKIIDSTNKSVKIKMQESLADEITVKYSSNTLIINGSVTKTYECDYNVAIEISGYVFDDLDLSGAVNATVDSKALSGDSVELILSGASKIEVDTLTQAKIAVELSGASRIKCNSIKTSDINVTLSGASSIEALVSSAKCEIDSSGASKVTFSGSITKLDLEASGASRIKCDELIVNELEIKLSGASSASLIANSSINGELSGASELEYKGEAKVNVDTDTSSSVVKK